MSSPVADRNDRAVGVVGHSENSWRAYTVTPVTSSVLVIKLDDEGPFWSGQNIKGTVQLSLTKSFALGGVKIKFSGDVRACWEVGGDMSRKIHDE